MTYLHTFWARPQFDSPAHAASHDIVLWDFEALTWLTSALELRRLGPVRLITDTRGLRFVERTRLAWLYQDAISIELDDLAQDIHPGIFWTAGKIQALANAATPCCSVDLDAVLWQPLELQHRVLGLHTEPKEWDWYASNQQRFARFGFEDAAWDWAVCPVNTGILAFADPEPARAYAQTALEFMRAYSAYARATWSEDEIRSRDFSDAMLFADQRLLPMSAARLGIEVGCLGHLHDSGMHLRPQPACTHLWSSKVFYKYCVEARMAYANHLIRHIQTHHPQATDTLRHWNLDESQSIDPSTQLDLNMLPADDPRRSRFSLLEEIKGVVWIEDPNLGVRRRATNGSLISPGDVIRPEPGARYALVVNGRERLRFGQTA
jgi:hypothetical protein